MPEPETIESLRFDEALERLERLALQLEQGDIPLEEALAVYERAVRLFRHCRTRLDEVERKLELLTRDLDGDVATESIDEPPEAGTDE